MYSRCSLYMLCRGSLTFLDKQIENVIPVVVGGCHGMGIAAVEECDGSLGRGGWCVAWMVLGWCILNVEADLVCVW